ncbi:MAG TPA: hypothetical protein VIT67_09365 [Povalibacter sp.]
MKRLIAIVASVVINAAALSIIAAGINQSGTPAGIVSITELAAQDSLPVYALADEQHQRLSL